LVLHASFHVCQSLSTASSITHIYPLSLHDALPISHAYEANIIRTAFAASSDSARASSASTAESVSASAARTSPPDRHRAVGWRRDRKSTRLNSSHVKISYAVFCLKKKIYSHKFLYI